MKKVKDINRSTMIQFRIVDIKKLSYYQNDFISFGLSDSDITKGMVSIKAQHNLDSVTGIVSIKIKIDFDCRKQDQTFKLFGIKTEHRFQIRNFRQNYSNNKNGSFEIPDGLIITFLNISVSGTRGMLVALNSIQAYSSIILPIINPQEILNKIKENNLVKK